LIGFQIEYLDNRVGIGYAAAEGDLGSVRRPGCVPFVLRVFRDQLAGRSAIG
jgi:hypothetical protein